jgi:hypothetical protein
MADLKDSFTTFDGTGISVTHGVNWHAQTFVTGSAYTITDVALNCWKFGSPGNITVSIRKTTGGKPSGGDLCSATVADSEISTLPSLAYYIFTFASSYALDDVTKYAIVWRAPNGNAANYFTPFGDGAAGYADGGTFTSADSGSSWGSEGTSADANFRTYGETPVPGKPTNPSPTDAVSDVTLDETPLSWDASVDGDADTYEVYFRESGDDWELVGVAQAGVEWTIDFGILAYETTYEWRIDATNVYGTTVGDTWTFDTIDFDRIRVSYRLISGGNGYGPYDFDAGGNPQGTEGTDWAWTGENTMLTVKRLVAAANSKIWYESI